LKALKLRDAEPKPNASTLSPTQVDAFLDHADGVAHPVYAAPFRGTAGCAARIDEMRHHEAWDVDEERGLLTISPKKGWTTKGYRYRDFPISEVNARSVKVFIKRQTEVRLERRSEWKELQRVRKDMDLPRFSMHELRSAWASAMHANAASLKQVCV
jgi:integrase